MSRAILLTAFVTASCSATSPPPRPAPAPLTIERHGSEPGFAVNSYLIAGEHEALLVDGQLFTAEAQAVASLIQASGKDLKWIFLTHAHPDHYLGLATLHDAFPAASIVTSPRVAAEFHANAPAAFAAAKAALGAAIPDRLAEVSAHDEPTLRIDGRELTIIELAEAGESGASAMLALDSPRVLLTGDALYTETHLFLSECHATGWLANLEAIRALGYDVLYPGHGAPGSPALLDANATYIRAATSIMNGAAAPEPAKAQLLEIYPTYAGARLLNLSTSTYHRTCRTP